jgi:oligoribonuclease (3'-5' exoribonuclease)
MESKEKKQGKLGDPPTENPECSTESISEIKLVGKDLFLAVRIEGTHINITVQEQLREMNRKCKEQHGLSLWETIKPVCPEIAARFAKAIFDCFSKSK